ncbi:hypothetical protein EXE53_31540 [Halorubrum sp. SD626R]|uniref:hypothetical protein n=1 Tax=Halorubrum sp. SD626R TaxID=1419722 RepID=UPI0010F5C771|nr:hypothetical protein [Halorubrum sp. SD626R]TKX76501.1 hypothetical protein EXE53_31540 [Halorubrum sp. SD626R]
MPSADEIQRIIEQSTPSDWRRFSTTWNNLDPDSDGGIIAVYEPDVNLRIELGRVSQEGYKSDWSDKYPNNEDNKSHRCWVMYQQSPVDWVTVIAVDGFSAYIKAPDPPASEGKPWTIEKYGDMIGRSISSDDRIYQEKRELAGIELK